MSVTAGGNGTELVGSETVGLLVMTRAGTPLAAALQAGTARLGALGDGSTATGSTESMASSD